MLWFFAQIIIVSALMVQVFAGVHWDAFSVVDWSVAARAAVAVLRFMLLRTVAFLKHGYPTDI